MIKAFFVVLKINTSKKVPLCFSHTLHLPDFNTGSLFDIKTALALYVVFSGPMKFDLNREDH